MGGVMMVMMMIDSSDSNKGGNDLWSNTLSLDHGCVCVCVCTCNNYVSATMFQKQHVHKKT